MADFKVLKERYGLFLAVVFVAFIVAIIAVAPTGYITLNTACIDTVPTVTFSPSTQSGAAGSELMYTINVKNNDPSACSASEYELSTSYCTSGWTCGVYTSSNYLTINPGATDSSTTLRIQSPSTGQQTLGPGYPSKVKANYKFGENFIAGSDVVARGWESDEQGWVTGALTVGKASWVTGLTAGEADNFMYNVYTKKKFSDFSISSRLMITEGDGYALVGGRYLDRGNWYAAFIDDQNNKVGVIVRSNWGTPTQSYVSTPIATNTWYTVKFEVVGNKLKMYLNGVPKLTISRTNIKSGFAFIGTNQVAAGFNNAVITSLLSGEGTAYYKVTAPIQPTLKINKIGSGTVTSTPAPSISCSATTSTCSKSYSSGTTVDLTPSASQSSTFVSWAGCDSTLSGNKCRVTMPNNGIKEVTATFTAIAPSDTIPPSLLVSHTESSIGISPSTPVTIEATAEDYGGIAEIKISVDNTLAKTCASSPCSISQTYTAGPHTYYATAKDAAGNSARNPTTGTKSFTVTAASSPLTLTITAPQTGSTVTTNSIVVTGTASTDVGLRRIEIKVGEGTFVVVADYSAVAAIVRTASWSKRVTLATGSNTITVKVTDTSGNTERRSVNITYSANVTYNE